MVDALALAISTLSLIVAATTAWLTLFRRGTVRMTQPTVIFFGRDQPIWVYGERDKLIRGSGLFVGETGVSANHHFLTPEDGKMFTFTEGHYKLDVFAHLLGDLKPIRVFSQELDISRDIATALREKNAGFYFDWGPDSSRYLVPFCDFDKVC